MIVFASAVFVSAFLVFQVQPLLGKYILPWYGGSPTVWTTCLLFFQILLLGGYGYAHLSVRKLRPHIQVLVHVVLLAVAFLFLPIVPREAFKPQGNEAPVMHILWVLTATVGLPYLVLSATGPLLQSWFSKTHPARSPYILYAFSNFGSLLGLLSYPLIIEPTFGRYDQTLGWSGAFVVSAALALVCGIFALRAKQPSIVSHEDEPFQILPWMIRALWIALPAVGSTLLLAITNQLCTDVASIPLLWVLPLSAYLFSFVITFSGAWEILRWPCLAATGVILAAVSVILLSGGVTPVDTQIQVWTSAVLLCCMVCHGELYRLRPEPRLLTGFYLSIALGGAIGGIFVGVVAPLVFNMYLELHLGLAACLGLIILCLWLDKSHWMHEGIAARMFIPLVVAALVFVLALYKHAEINWFQTVFDSRNFFGVLRVKKTGTGPEAGLTLFHGTITHGMQYTDPRQRHIPTTYYGEKSGVGVALRNFMPRQNQRVGMVGLGAGTLAAYGKEGDYYRIYEINPDVVKIATTHFSFMADSAAHCEIIEGDARISMERELLQGKPQKFDVLALDAFSGDAVPFHLLTREAFAVYFKHLDQNGDPANEGILAVHISSLYFDLKPVVYTLAQEFNAAAALIKNETDDTPGAARSIWILITRNKAFLSTPAITDRATPVVLGVKDSSATDKHEIIDIECVRLWTDDYSNPLHFIIKK